MAIIDDSDIQIHLPVDKLNIDGIADDLDNVKRDVERIVRGYLAGVISATTLATWTTPASTPGIIRGIGGRLGAALIYRLRLGGQSLKDPEYSQNKYNEAMAMLNDIRSGALIIQEVTETVTQFNNTYFFPNGTTDDPRFAMGARF